MLQLRFLCLLPNALGCIFFLFVATNFESSNAVGQSADPNRLTYLDDFCNPYYAGTKFPKLSTPQWVGEEGVDAVITLGIDDMRDPARYEAYLRPILDRLKKIDKRAPVSIFTCSVAPDNAQLQSWLEEGLSLECHTVDHPCPCLQNGKLAVAKSTYDRCVDMLYQIKDNRPVAFRFPCCDSLNTPSPRAFAEIVNRATENKKFLQASSSVVCLFTNKDPDLPIDLFVKEKNRFQKYIPFPSFVNRIDNYPYPFLIGGKCWEFPIAVPDDWQGQNINRPNNPQTVEDLKAAIDATVVKKGITNIVFHPHGWIRAEQIVETIDYVEEKYGKRVKFLTFKECVSRINRHLLLNQPVRHPETGLANGVRILDVNNDGFLDVMIGNREKKTGRIWQPKSNQFLDFDHPFDLSKCRFGIAEKSTWCIEANKDQSYNFYSFDTKLNRWQKRFENVRLEKESTIDAIRLRDLNQDNNFELIHASPNHRLVYQVNFSDGTLSSISFPAPIVDEQGNDYGTRFVDLDQDGHEDLIVSNDQKSDVLLFDEKKQAFQSIQPGTELPLIVSGGKNNGVWFANQFLWMQNEHTNRLPDGVDRRSFQQILGETDPKPKSPKAALKSFQLDSSLEIELMAAEPLVMDPVAIEWGVDGKLWVVEMADYPLGLDDRGKPGGRVRYLEDTDNDGKYDRSTLFVDKIPFPTGVFPMNTDPDKPACLITAAPYLVYADKKGNWQSLLKSKPLKKDTPRIWLEGFGEGNQQHRFNGFALGLDNWFYLANGDSGGSVRAAGSKTALNIRGRDLRFRRTGNGIQFETQTGQTQFGRHFDDWGNAFGCSNPIPIRHYVLPEHYLSRNSSAKYPAARNDLARSDNTQLFPISRILSHWSGYRPPAPGQPHRFTSACSTNFYRDNLFAEEFQSSTFTCEPVHNLVHRRVLSQNGVTFTSQRSPSDSDREFLASNDSWFRPAYITTGPDGALWVCDMYRLVIEHPEWIDDQREKELFLRAGHDRGRIYRIFPKKAKLRSLPSHSAFAEKKKADHVDQVIQFVKRIGSPNRWDREMAQRIAVSHPEIPLKEDLAKLATGSTRDLTRLHAACALEGRNELQAEVVIKLLEDPSARIRKEAIRLAEPFLNSNRSVQSAVSQSVKDSDSMVLFQLAFSLGEAKSKHATETLQTLADKKLDDPYFRAALMSSLNDAHVSNLLIDFPATPNPIHFIAITQAIRRNQVELAENALGRWVKREQTDWTSPSNLRNLGECLRAIRDSGSSAGFGPEFRKSIQELTTRLATDSKFDSIDFETRIQLCFDSPFSPEPELTTLLLKHVSTEFSPKLQIASIRRLAKIDSDEIVIQLLKRWESASPSIRAEILTTMVQRNRWIRLFLKQLPKHPSVRLTSRQKRVFLLHSDAAISTLAKATFGEPDLSARADVVDRYQTQIKSIDVANQSVAEQGRALFKKHCSNCHRVGDLGTAVGPDLQAVKDRSKDAFLVAIFDPARAVEDKYVNYLVELLDGRQITGIIKSESGNQITLVNQEGKQQVILRKEIDRIKSSGKSLMPEGLENELTTTQTKALLTFLFSQATAPKRKTFAGNTPSLINPNSKGTLLLSAEASEIYGPSLVFESKYKNLGFWGSQDDLAKWRFKIDQPQTYDVWLRYACDPGNAGNSFQLNIAGKNRQGKVTSTKSWDNYERIKIGEVQLTAGDHTASFSSLDSLKGFLLDLQSIELIPQD